MVLLTSLLALNNLSDFELLCGEVHVTGKWRWPLVNSQWPKDVLNLKLWKPLRIWILSRTMPGRELRDRSFLSCEMRSGQPERACARRPSQARVLFCWNWDAECYFMQFSFEICFYTAIDNYWFDYRSSKAWGCGTKLESELVCTFVKRHQSGWGVCDRHVTAYDHSNNLGWWHIIELSVFYFETGLISLYDWGMGGGVRAGSVESRLLSNLTNDAWLSFFGDTENLKWNIPHWRVDQEDTE